ncbi:trehalose operon repressor [Lactovum miscens]|uniref:Trehalose operon repressor n=1 Tax=Lactovum miscens TaxID=190387 RepID=A0A841CAA9_9LACT|nr:trehalose operon repressor [Lactovum miscens]MBB5888329.1 GntR family trehalose operon transcriptional repressor [Lactovum miscens]
MKKYGIIVTDLEQKIFKDIYKENELLPSEHELSKIYDCSRATVRQALKIVEENGLIQRRHGYGSIVISHEKLLFPISGLTSFKELQTSLGFQSKTEVIIFGEINIDEQMAKMTGFPLDSVAYHILRRRQIDGKFAVLDRDFLRKDIAGDLTKEISQNSIYEYLENTLNLDIAYAQKEITIDLVCEEDHELLDLNQQDRHIVSVKSHVYLANNTQFQYTESRHQVDKFRFTEIARRQKR